MSGVSAWGGKESLISVEKRIFITNGNWKLNVRNSAPLFDIFHSFGEQFGDRESAEFIPELILKHSLPSISLIVHRLHPIADPFPVHKSQNFPL